LDLREPQAFEPAASQDEAQYYTPRRARSSCIPEGVFKDRGAERPEYNSASRHLRGVLCRARR